MQTLILKFAYALGDTVLLTALVRDIHLTYPGRYKVMVDSRWTPVWWNNPRVSKLEYSSPHQLVEINYGKGITASKNGEKVHFLSWLHRDFEKKTGIRLKVHEPKGEIFLTESESVPWINGRYWVMVAGGKLDMTVKHWEHSRYQELVYALRKQGIQCVQVGAVHNNHVHPPLKGVLNAVGRTENVRDLFGLIKHADGVICGITGAMHIAAVFDRPCVVIAGGREEPWWESYTNAFYPTSFGPGCAKVKVEHKYLHTLGLLPCCDKKGCWKARTVPIEESDTVPPEVFHLCSEPVKKPGAQSIPKCLDLVGVAHVLEAVMSYYEGDTPVLPPIGEPDKKYTEIITVNSGYELVDSEGKRVGWSNDWLKNAEMSSNLVFTRPPSLDTKPQSVLHKLAPTELLPKTLGFPKGLEHPILGGRLTVFVLCWGPHPELAKRCIDSILKTMPPKSFDLRVGCNECCPETIAYLKDQPLTKLYVNTQNRLKYRTMRDMFWDPDCPILSEYLVWFDDDSFVVKNNWVEKLCEVVINNHPTGCRLYGIEFLHNFAGYRTPTHSPETWFNSASWFRDKYWLAGRDGRFETPNGATIRFVSGGFWALHTQTMRDADIPDRRLLHNGGDICIGAQVRQAGFRSMLFNKNKEYVHSSGAPPRGLSRSGEKKHFPWEESGEGFAT